MDTQRVVEIIIEEARKVEARYPSYAGDVCEVVAEIVNIERQHRFAARNVKQDIAAQINILGTGLAANLAEQAQ